ncbi:MAG: FtsX-like permease family protein, partial [Lachnospiraceae bacterium]|nr:FtsX-like permease family protein [Lachnospiraceae bacterium]
MKIVFKHILRNIWSKKGRSFLIVLALTVATTVFTLNLTLPDELVLKIQQTYRSIYGDVDIAMNTVEEFKLEDVELGDKEIRYTNTLVMEGLFNDKPTIIRGLNIEEAKEFKMLNSDVPALTGNQIVISEKQAKDFGFSQGQKIKVLFEDKEYEFDIVKIVENRGLNSIYDEYPQFICNIDEIAKIRNISSEMTDCLFIDVVEEGAAKEYAEYLIDNNENYMAQALTDEENIRENTVFISYILLLVFVMAIIMIMFVVSSLNKIIIAERMPVIGTFRSIGATKAKMNGILMLENAMYGLIGGFIGGIIGYKLNSTVAGLFITTNGVDLTQDTSKIDVKLILIGLLFAVLLQVVITAKAIIKANKKPVKDLIFDLHSSRYRVLKHRNIIGVILVVAALVTNYVLKDANIIITILVMVMLITGIAMVVPYLLQKISKLFSLILRKFGWQTAFVASKNIGYNKMIVTSSRVVVVALSLMLAIVTISTSVTNLFQSFRIISADYDFIMQGLTKDELEYDKLLEIDGITKIDYMHAYMDEITYNDGKEFTNSPIITGMRKSAVYIKE